MHYLSLALYAEGPTDYHFLSPLLRRLTEEICLQRATQQVEIGEEVTGLNHPKASQLLKRELRILDAARSARGAWRILFIHTDGAGDPSGALEERVSPAIKSIGSELKSEGIAVPVIPIRETEAWALIDGDALRQAFGCTLSDRELMLPTNPYEIEGCIDPKLQLETAFNATNPTKSKKRIGYSYVLSEIGEAVSLDRLHKLPSFQTTTDALQNALQSLQIIR